MYKVSKTSILWGGKVSDVQRDLAKVYAIELLRLSYGTERLRAHMLLPRGDRAADRKQYLIDQAHGRAELARVEQESRQLIVDRLTEDPAKVMDLFRSWDEDGDGEVSHSEFQ